ncbi:MAG: PilN domain-containing protein [Pontibacterium sp.]
MKQQVNLYTPKVPAARDIWSLPSAILLVLLVVLLAAFVSWGAHQYANAQIARLTALKTEQAGLPDQIALLEKQRKELRPAAAIIQEQEQVQQDIAGKRELADLLRRMQPGVTNHGFAVYLFSLAEAVRPGVWLTEFELDLAAQGIQLKGLTRQADAVPLLLRGLGETPAFSALAVSEFSVTQQDNVHRFEVQARLGGEGGHGER